ncbi:MAG: hypothetical protein WDN45_14220 [Caulobacteraceae bacterium]
MNLLWRTADDLGISGTDLHLRLGRHESAAGVPARGRGERGAVERGQRRGVGSPGAFVASAVGDAIVNGGGLKTAGRDVYNRLFVVNLAQGYQPSGASIISPDPASIVRSSDEDLPSFAQGRMHVTAALANGRIDPSDHFHWMLSNPQSGDLSVSYARGGVTLMAWKGSGLANPFFAQTVDPFTSAAQPDQAVRADFARGPFHFTAEAGSGERLTPDRMQRQNASHYVSGGGQMDLGPLHHRLHGGRTDRTFRTARLLSDPEFRLRPAVQDRFRLGLQPLDRCAGGGDGRAGQHGPHAAAGRLPVEHRRRQQRLAGRAGRELQDAGSGLHGGASVAVAAP